MKYIILSCSVILLACLLLSFQPKESKETHEKDAYTIVTTVSMLADSTRNIVGTFAEVTELMGPGIDPHVYIPARSDIIQIQSADMVFYIGALLEGQLSNTLDTMSNKGREVHALIHAIEEQDLIIPDNAHAPDPHVWMDVQLWMHVVDAIRDYVAAFDPERAAYYYANAQGYKLKLQELDESNRSLMSSVSHRTLITAHDAFNYFGRAYDFDVIGIQGLSTESEAGIADINYLVDLIVSEGIPSIFFESSVSDKYIRAVIEGAANRDFPLRIGGQLFSDALGGHGSGADTYVTMIRSNVQTISHSLGGLSVAE